jgi:hypothetical protein
MGFYLHLKSKKDLKFVLNAKLKSASPSRDMMDRNAETQAAHLTNYLDEGLRIPRPHLNDICRL